MTVEILASTVVAHGGARVRVACGDLNVAQIHTGVEHGGDEGMSQDGGCMRGSFKPVDSARRRSRRGVQ